MDSTRSNCTLTLITYVLGRVGRVTLRWALYHIRYNKLFESTLLYFTQVYSIAISSVPLPTLHFPSHLFSCFPSLLLLLLSYSSHLNFSPLLTFSLLLSSLPFPSLNFLSMHYYTDGCKLCPCYPPHWEGQSTRLLSGNAVLCVVWCGVVYCVLWCTVWCAVMWCVLWRGEEKRRVVK